MQKISLLVSLLFLFSQNAVGKTSTSQKWKNRPAFSNIRELKKDFQPGLIILAKKKSALHKAYLLARKGGLTLSTSGVTLPFAVFRPRAKSRASTYNKLCSNLLKSEDVIYCSPILGLSLANSELKSPIENAEVAPSKSHKISCSLLEDTPSIDYGTIPDFWAREAIGYDLVEKERESTNGKIVTPPSYICDITATGHAEKVRNIVDGYRAHSEVRDCTNTEEVLKVLDEILTKHPNQLVFVNNSMQMHRYGGKKFFETINQPFMQKIFWVSASGNRWLDRPNLTGTNSIEKYQNFIFVGSTSPNGLPSSFSNENERLFVSAPSDTSNTVCDSDGVCSIFSGTSGAAPFVDHAAKAVAEVLPNISKNQLLEMISKTTIKMPFSFETPKLNGGGMINSYKLWRVAKKIRSNCNLEAKCIDRMVADRSTYRFQRAVTGTEVRSAFPTCTGANPRKIDCKLQKSVYTKLRIEALLAPDRILLWRTLGCIQGQSGYSGVESLYSNIGLDVLNEKQTAKDLGINQIDGKFLRNFKYLKDARKLLTTLPLVKKGQADDTGFWERGGAPKRKGYDTHQPSLSLFLEKSLFRLGENADIVANRAMADPSPYVRIAAIKGMEKIGSSSIPFLRETLKTETNAEVIEQLELSLKNMNK